MIIFYLSLQFTLRIAMNLRMLSYPVPSFHCSIIIFIQAKFCLKKWVCHPVTQNCDHVTIDHAPFRFREGVGYPT